MATAPIPAKPGEDGPPLLRVAGDDRVRLRVVAGWPQKRHERPWLALVRKLRVGVIRQTLERRLPGGAAERVEFLLTSARAWPLLPEAHVEGDWWVCTAGPLIVAAKRF